MDCANHVRHMASDMFKTTRTMSCSIYGVGGFMVCPFVLVRKQGWRLMRFWISTTDKSYRCAWLLLFLCAHSLLVCLSSHFKYQGHDWTGEIILVMPICVTTVAFVLPATTMAGLDRVFGMGGLAGVPNCVQTFRALHQKQVVFSCPSKCGSRQRTQRLWSPYRIHSDNGFINFFFLSY